MGWGEEGGEGKDSKTVSSKFSSQARKVGDTMPVDGCPDKSASRVFNQTNVPTKGLGLEQSLGLWGFTGVGTVGLECLLSSKSENQALGREP